MDKREVLETAISTVADRGIPYGGVEDNFARIAILWKGYLKARFGIDHDITPSDTAALMALMKIGRIAGNPNHLDSWVDVAGYAACGGELATR